MWPGNGQQGPPESPATHWDVWLAVAGLLGIIALGIGAIVWFKRWRDEAVEFDTLSHAEQLDHYQKMVDEGDLDPEEYARIKAQLEMRAAHPELPPSGKAVSQPPADQPPDTSIQE